MIFVWGGRRRRAGTLLAARARLQSGRNAVSAGGVDKLEHKPLYEVIVLRVREMGLAGATVARGVEVW